MTRWSLDNGRLIEGSVKLGGPQIGENRVTGKLRRKVNFKAEETVTTTADVSK